MKVIFALIILSLTLMACDIEKDEHIPQTEEKEEETVENDKSEDKTPEDVYFSRVFFNTNTSDNLEMIEMHTGVEHSQADFPDFKKEGYIFLGWSTTENKEDIFKTITFPNQDDVRLHAFWEVIETKILYNHPDFKDETIGYNEEFTPETPNIPKGQEFIQWYIDEEKTMPWSSDFLNQLETYTLHPRFEITEYTITFKEETVKEKAFKYGDSFSHIAYTPEKEDNDFVGWFTNEDLTQLFDMEIMEDYDLTLYAKWSLTYYITYNLSEGINNEDNPKTYNIETTPINLEDPTKYGYRFLGWFDAESEGTEIKTIEEGNVGDKTLYAQWELAEYTITYNLFGGVNNEDNPETYNIETTPVNLEDPIKEGYIFDGWYSPEENRTISKGRYKTINATWITQVKYKIDEFGFFDNPLAADMDDNHLYFGGDEFIYVYEKETGEFLYQTSSYDEQPVVLTVDDNYIYSGGARNSSTHTNIRIHEKSTGNLVNEEFINYGSRISFMVVTDNHIYIGGGGPVKAYDKVSGDFLYETEDKDIFANVITVDDNYFYVATPFSVRVYEKGTGVLVYVTERYGLDLPSTINAITIDENYIYVGGNIFGGYGTSRAVNPVKVYEKSTGTFVYETELFYGSITSIAVDEDYIYVAGAFGDGRTTVYEKGTGNVAYHSTRQMNVYTIMIDDDHIYTAQGAIYKEIQQP